MNSIKSLVNSFDKFYPNSTFDDSVILQINDIPEEEEGRKMIDKNLSADKITN